ncbi:MAG: CoA transferase [Deltaproteobacteria bacterium]|nr:CoA transferase [Deltaproteobacteria bacterium]
MSGILDGVRIVELAQWIFVPSAGALLADLGADVIKVEDPRRGDPVRGLRTQGLGSGRTGPDLAMHQNNRGKRSVGIDIKQKEGRELLLELVGKADVFLTSFRPASLERLGLGVEALRSRNSELIYARGHGLGVRGPDANRPSYDMSAFWSRGGIAHTLTPPDAEGPVMQRPGFGDHTTAMNLAFGIAAALFRRERRGEPSVVDVSLLGTAMWVLSSDVVYAGNADYEPHAAMRAAPANPLTATYRTRDGRFLALVMLQADRHWADFCRHLGRPEWVADPRYADATARRENAAVCTKELKELFATRTLAEWEQQLAGLDAAWEPQQSVRELRDDVQARANGYLTEVDGGNGERFDLVSNPCQFDESVPPLRPGPEVGAHTEEVLLELGLGWDEISALRAKEVL